MTRCPPPANRRRRPRALLVVGALAMCASAAGCGGSGPETAGPDQVDSSDVVGTGDPGPVTTGSPSTATTEPSTTTVDAGPPTTSRSAPPTTRPPSAPKPAPPAVAAPPADPRVTAVTAADLGASWHAGCPVGPTQLRRVAITYVGFDGAEHDGALVVNVDAVSATLKAFERLRTARFPIRKIVTVEHYGASDDASMADDNTSAFNCRLSTGSSGTWSQHAYGRAVDINPIENPYVTSSSIAPPAGGAYADRADVRPGMATAGNALVSAFGSVGWGWGGTWHSAVDYQHFSANGR